MVAMSPSSDRTRSPSATIFRLPLSATGCTPNQENLSHRPFSLSDTCALRRAPMGWSIARPT